MTDEEAFQRWAMLQNARRAAGPDRRVQNILGPIEHGAFAETFVRNNPVLGPLSMLGAIPAYELKKLAVGGEWSDPSLESMMQGFKGLGRGVAANLQMGLPYTTASPRPTPVPAEGLLGIARPHPRKGLLGR